MITQEKDIADPQLRQQQDAGSKKYDEAVNNNDAAAVAALYTEDAVEVTDRPDLRSGGHRETFCRRVQASSCQQPSWQRRSVFPSHYRSGQ